MAVRKLFFVLIFVQNQCRLIFSATRLSSQTLTMDFSMNSPILFISSVFHFLLTRKHFDGKSFFRFQLRSKMLRTRLDSATENFISKLFRQEKSHDFVSLHERSKFSYWRMSSSNYFQIYSLLAKSTKSAYQ